MGYGTLTEGLWIGFATESRKHHSNSCTVLISGKVRCIRDSEWKQCDEGYETEDFIRTIDEEYEKLNAK